MQSDRSPRTDRKILVTTGLSTVAFVFLLYLPALWGDLMGDDFVWLACSYDIVGNPLAVFHEINGFFRPLIKVSYLVDYLLYGAEPIGYVLTTLMIHLFNVALLYFFALKLFATQASSPERIYYAGMTALLFGCSSRYSEVVLYAAVRPDSLHLLFMLGYLLVLTTWPESCRARWFLLILAIGAAGCKESWVLLPPLAFALQILILKQHWRRAILSLWQTWLLWFVYLTVFVGLPMVLGGPSPTDYGVLSASEFVTKVAATFVSYIGVGDGVNAAPLTVGLVLFSILVLGLWCARKGMNVALWALIWSVLGVAISGTIAYAPARYNYLPLLGLSLMVVALLRRGLVLCRSRGSLPWHCARGTLVLLIAMYLIYHGRMIRIEIADYYQIAQSHRSLLDMYQTVAAQLPHDRPFIFVNNGTRKAVEEFIDGCRGHNKLFFVRSEALWQLVHLPDLVDFYGRPFDERLEQVSFAEVLLKNENVPVLLFTDQGFVVFTSPVEEFGKQLPAGVQAYQFVKSDAVAHR